MSSRKTQIHLTGGVRVLKAERGGGKAVRKFRCPCDVFWAIFGFGSPRLDLWVRRAVLNQEWGVGCAIPALDW